jgi:cobalt-zinc-cadmium efflux system membrane fusion protein
MNKLLILITGILFLSCGSQAPSEQKEQSKTSALIINFTGAQIKNAGLASGYPEERSISSILKVNGQIDVPPQNIVSVSVPLGGYLKSTHLLPGMHVKRGEVIATIEDQQYIQLQQDYLTALARLSFIESDYNRQKALNESKASSDKLFQQAEAEYKSEVILVKSLNEKLKLIGINPGILNENTLSRSVQITAPIDGFVSAVNVNIGKYVNPSEVLFELINPTDIHLALTVFEKDLDKLYIGQKLEAYTNHHPGIKYNCEIILISQNLSAERNVQVHCHFEHYDKTLIPGMYMNADIRVITNKAVVVPEDAVVSYEGKQYIFIEKEQGQYEMKEVTTGIVENGFIEITSPEKNVRQKVVLKGAYTLLMALKNRSDAV